MHRNNKQLNIIIMTKKQRSYLEKRLEEIKGMIPEMMQWGWDSNKDEDALNILYEIYNKGYYSGYNLGYSHGQDPCRQPY